MFKAKLISSIFTVIFLTTICNSYSQEKTTTTGSSELTINHPIKDLNPNARLFKLYQSKTTQFDNVTIIEFELGEEANVLLTVCDSKGNIVETLINELMDAGNYNLNYKSQDKIIAGKFTYKLEVKGISGIKNTFAVK